jgi:hypothetical protein
MLGALAFCASLGGFIAVCLLSDLFESGRDNATSGPVRSSARVAHGDSETDRSIAMGGCASEQPVCHASRPDWPADDYEPFHDRRIAR